MAREAHAERARRKGSLEEKQPSSFPSLPGPKAVQSFLAKSRIWGFLLRYFTIKILFLVIYINRKIDPSILSDFYFDIEKRIYFIQRLIQRTVLSPPPLMKGLCCNGWQRVRSTRSTGVIQQPGRGLEVPTTTPHYTWLYTFTELTPVQCLAELRGLQSLLFILIFAQANGALLIQGGEWSLEKHC